MSLRLTGRVTMLRNILVQGQLSRDWGRWRVRRRVSYFSGKLLKDEANLQAASQLSRGTSVDVERRAQSQCGETGTWGIWATACGCLLFSQLFKLRFFSSFGFFKIKTFRGIKTILKFQTTWLMTGMWWSSDHQSLGRAECARWFPTAAGLQVLVAPLYLQTRHVAFSATET